MKEGRRVTRCAISVLKDINKYCFDEFKLHYECLEQNNQYFSRCRSSEGVLSKCVFDNMKLVKKFLVLNNKFKIRKIQFIHLIQMMLKDRRIFEIKRSYSC